MKIKKLLATFSLIFIVALVVNISGCKNSDPTAKTTNTALLAAQQWTLQSLKINGVNETDLYKDLTLKFESSIYQATNGEPIWSSSGTWSFTDDTAKSFVIEDDVLVTVEQLDQTSLKISLTWNSTTFEEGRAKSVEGEHEFTFTH